MWKYYRDVTLYAIAICFLSAMATTAVYDGFISGLIKSVLIFGVFGTGLGVLAFSYFQKQQYYMYYNLGFTKRYLILKSWVINFGISIIISILLLPLL